MIIAEIEDNKSKKFKQFRLGTLKKNKDNISTVYKAETEKVKATIAKARQLLTPIKLLSLF